MKIDNPFLRPAQADDEPFLFALFVATTDISLYEALPAQMREQILQMQFKARQQTFHGYASAEDFVVELAGACIGRIFIQETRDELRLIDIALLPTAQGNGIGSHLFTQLCQRCDASKIPLRLHVSTTNDAAQRFYMRHGCTIITRDEAHLFMKRSFL